MNQIARWILALMPIMMAQVSSADPFYKWVDDQGATHYTQTPPPHKKVSKIDVDTHVPSDSAEEIKNLQTESQDDLKDIDASEKAAEDAKTAAAADTARKHKNSAECQQIHASLALLLSGQRLHTNDANGERSYLTEDQKSIQIQQETAQIQKDCP